MKYQNILQSFLYHRINGVNLKMEAVSPESKFNKNKHLICRINLVFIHHINYYHYYCYYYYHYYYYYYYCYYYSQLRLYQANCWQDNFFWPGMRRLFCSSAFFSSFNAFIFSSACISLIAFLLIVSTQFLI